MSSSSRRVLDDARGGARTVAPAARPVATSSGRSASRSSSRSRWRRPRRAVRRSTTSCSRARPGSARRRSPRSCATSSASASGRSQGPALERKGDIAAILTSLEPRDVLFVDEIHRLNRAAEEILYPALEDFRLDIIVGQGPAARTLTLDLPPFTLIGATTRTGLLTTPLRDRFGLTFRLDLYTPGELASIVRRSASILGVEIADDAAELVARRSRGTPRIANRILRRVRDVAEVRHEGKVTTAIAEESLDAARGRRRGARAVRPRTAALRRREVRRRPGRALDPGRRARRGARDDRGRLRAVPAAARLSPADPARPDRHRSRPCPSGCARRLGAAVLGSRREHHRPSRRCCSRLGRRARPVRPPAGDRQPVRPFRRQRPWRRLGRTDRGVDRRRGLPRRSADDAQHRQARARRQGARLRAVLRACSRVRPGDERRGRRLRLRGRRTRDGERRLARLGGHDGGGCGRVGHAREAARRRARRARGGPFGDRRAGRRRRVRDAGARADRGRVALLRGGSGVPRGGRASRARRPRAGHWGRRRRRSVRRWRVCSRTRVSRTAFRMRASFRCRPRSTRSRAFARTTCSSCTGWRAGVVLVAHTDAGPRGFTLLCRRLGLRLADVASAQLGVALTQEWCSKRPIGFTPSSGSSTPPDQLQRERRGQERHHVEPHVARRHAARRVPVRDAEARQLVRPAPGADRGAVQLE